MLDFYWELDEEQYEKYLFEMLGEGYKPDHPGMYECDDFTEDDTFNMN